jgi:hypothetical protein
MHIIRRQRLLSQELSLGAAPMIWRLLGLCFCPLPLQCHNSLTFHYVKAYNSNSECGEISTKI